MEDINRHYRLNKDICQRGNMSDKVDKEEEEKVRTFHSPQDEQHSCFTHEALKTANSNRTNINKETQMAPTVPIVHLNVLK